MRFAALQMSVLISRRAELQVESHGPWPPTVSSHPGIVEVMWLPCKLRLPLDAIIVAYVDDSLTYAVSALQMSVLTSRRAELQVESHGPWPPTVSSINRAYGFWSVSHSSVGPKVILYETQD